MLKKLLLLYVMNNINTTNPKNATKVYAINSHETITLTIPEEKIKTFTKTNQKKDVNTFQQNMNELLELYNKKEKIKYEIKKTAGLLQIYNHDRMPIEKSVYKYIPSKLENYKKYMTGINTAIEALHAEVTRLNQTLNIEALQNENKEYILIEELIPYIVNTIDKMQSLPNKNHKKRDASVNTLTAAYKKIHQKSKKRTRK